MNFIEINGNVYTKILSSVDGWLSPKEEKIFITTDQIKSSTYISMSRSLFDGYQEWLQSEWKKEHLEYLKTKERDWQIYNKKI